MNGLERSATFKHFLELKVGVVTISKRFALNNSTHNAASCKEIVWKLSLSIIDIEYYLKLSTKEIFVKMPARSDVFGSPDVLEQDDLPSISDTIRYARYLQDYRGGGCVSFNSLGKS